MMGWACAFRSLSCSGQGEARSERAAEFVDQCQVPSATTDLEAPPAHVGSMARRLERGEMMESRTKVFGHPIHPMLVVFPMGLFISAVIFDLLYFWGGNTALASVAFWNIGVGIIGGLLAAVFGTIDWFAIPAGTRAKRLGLLHGVGNVVVVLMFAASWWLRSTLPDFTPSTAATALAVVAVMLVAVTGWLGGELVDRLGVGVDDGAHLDAPSSLTSQHVPSTARRPAL
jgi:uncharacterized membrane protein